MNCGHHPDYAKQETIDPLKGVGRYLTFGVPGALLIGFGMVLLMLSGLRALQTQTGSTFHGSLSWLPYIIVLVVAAGLVALPSPASPRRRGRPMAVSATSTKPITRDDLEAKFRSSRAGHASRSHRRGPRITGGGIAVFLLLLLVFLLGRRGGKQRSTVVEIRRV